MIHFPYWIDCTPSRSALISLSLLLYRVVLSQDNLWYTLHDTSPLCIASSITYIFLSKHKLEGLWMRSFWHLTLPITIYNIQMFDIPHWIRIVNWKASWEINHLTHQTLNCNCDIAISSEICGNYEWIVNYDFSRFIWVIICISWHAHFYIT